MTHTTHPLKLLITNESFEIVMHHSWRMAIFGRKRLWINVFKIKHADKKTQASFEILFRVIDLFMYCQYSMGRDGSADGPVWVSMGYVFNVQQMI